MSLQDAWTNVIKRHNKNAMKLYKVTNVNLLHNWILCNYSSLDHLKSDLVDMYIFQITKKKKSIINLILLKKTISKK